MAPQSAKPLLTDRARRVLERAREEQRRLGHPRLAAEHILLGLLADRRGLSAFVLRELGVKETDLSRRAGAELEGAAPDPVIGEDAVIQAARRWAGELQQVSVGTEHLLLALIGVGGAAGRWLQDAGVREAEARATTVRLFHTVRRRSGEVEPPRG
jgi:ATP-dependent Clp protease ATP-binding subunit ClpC